MYITPKSPKGWHKNAISLFVPVKFNFSRKKSATKFLCMKTSSGKVVAISFPYPTVHRSIAGDVPIYMKLAFKVTHPFRKRRFPKLSFKSAIGLGAFWSCFPPYDTLAIHWHPQKISSNLLNEVGLSLFRYFEVGLRVCDIVVKKFTFAISSPDEFLFCVLLLCDSYSYAVTCCAPRHFVISWL